MKLTTIASAVPSGKTAEKQAISPNCTTLLLYSATVPPKAGSAIVARSGSLGTPRRYHWHPRRQQTPRHLCHSSRCCSIDRCRRSDRRSTRTLRLAGLLGGLAIAVLVVAGATRPDGRAHVIVLDVAQGQMEKNAKVLKN